jgi:flagellar motor switch protein FliM
MGPATAEPIEDAEVVWREREEEGSVAELLGFDFGAAADRDRSGLRALIDSALVSHRRLPMLDVVFDRTARLMTTCLRQIADENVEVTLEDVGSVRFTDFQQGANEPAVIAVARAPQLDAYALLAADGSFLLTIVDALLGGRRGSGGIDPSERGFTAIELAIAQRVFAALVATLGEAFSPVFEGGFQLQRIETTSRFAAIAQGASVCVLAKFRVRFENEVGRASVLMPQAALEPIRKQLERAFLSEAKEAERAWRDELGKQAAAASLNLDVVLADETISLSRLGELSVGDTLTFRRSPRAAARIKVGDVIIGHAQVGRLGDTVAIRVLLDEPQDIVAAGSAPR